MRQSINIVVNPSYSKTNWFSDFYNGVLTKANSSDVNIMLCDSNPDEISESCLKNNRYVILVSSSLAWENKIINCFSKKNIHCLIIRPSLDNASLPCSSVSLDYFSATFDIMKYFIETGCKKIAFFAYNTDSSQDAQKFKAYTYALSLADLKFSEHDIYFNRGNIEDCANAIIDSINNYDALLCVNDVAAIVLINKLNKAALNKLTIASFGNTKLLKMIFPEIISASLNLKKAGECAADLYLYLCQNNAVTSCEYKVNSDIIIPSPKKRIFSLNQNQIKTDSKKEISFYNNSAVVDIFRIENALALCDELDFEIINSVIKKFSYEKTAEHTNTAVTTVKYRLKKIYSHFGVNSKKELCDYFDKYINSK